MQKALPYINLLLLILATGCGNFRKIERNPDWRVKYEAAVNYYNDKDYYRASILFEQILPVVRGLPEGEKVQFYMAYCQFHDKLYLLASEYFKTFYETYGRSTLAEEARFMYAYSLYEASPRYNLDQTNSIEAMTAMQTFLNRYPQSKFKDQATDVILKTQQKLERKGFENARQYYRMRYYEAAIVSLKNFVRNFPDSKYREEAEYMAISAQYQWAEQSIRIRQSDRYGEVVSFYKDFIDTYPQSEFLPEAEKLYVNSLEKLNELKTKNL